MRFLTAALLGLLANSALGQSFFDRIDKLYVGGGFNFIDAGGTDTDGNDANFTSFELQGGYKYNGFLAAEARVGFGLTDEDIATVAGDVETTIEYHASLYWRPETANEIAKIYGLLGFSTISVNADDGISDESESESGLSYGGGVGFVMQEDWNLNFEYRLILDKDDDEFRSFGATLDYRF